MNRLTRDLWFALLLLTAICDVYLKNLMKLPFQPRQFGPLASLRELKINAALMDDNEVIRSMILPNLRFLNVTLISYDEPCLDDSKLVNIFSNFILN
jgi:hypothetical protein